MVPNFPEYIHYFKGIFLPQIKSEKEILNNQVEIHYLNIFNGFYKKKILFWLVLKVLLCFPKEQLNGSYKTNNLHIWVF